MPVQYKSDAASSGAAAPPAASGAGRPLDRGTRAHMEQAFGTDFSGVRVHDTAAAGALAYTRGDDIHFRPGLYDPSSTGGRELLGHELAHVVQQRAGRVPAGPDGVNRDSSLEREADDHGARAARGETLATGGPAASARGDTAQLQQIAVPPEIWLVLLDARIMVMEAQLRLVRARKTGDPAVAQLVQEYFGNHVSIGDMIALLNAIKEQLARLHTGRRVQCYDGVGLGDPFADTPETFAANVGAGNDAIMQLRIPRFLQKSSRQQCQTLIHEASHGLPANPTRDIAYAHERLFRFLPALNLAHENADTISAFTGHLATGKRDRAHNRTPTDMVYDSQGQRGQKSAIAVPCAALGLVGLAGRATEKTCQSILAYLGTCQHQQAWITQGHGAARLTLNDLWFTKGILRSDLSFGAYITLFQDLRTLARTLFRIATQGSIGWILEDNNHGNTDNNQDDDSMEGNEAQPVTWVSPQVIRVGNCGGLAPTTLATSLLIQSFQVFGAGNYVGFATLFSAQMLDELYPPDDDNSSSSSSSDSEDDKGNDKHRDGKGNDKHHDDKGGDKHHDNTTGNTKGNTEVSQLKAGDASAPRAPAAAVASGGGAPLPAAFRGRMERAYGTDFSAVRVHEDGAAQDMGAVAFTRGTNIHVSPGAADVSSTRGQELLAHELTHVVQQREGRVRAEQRAGGVPINRDPGLEREADDRAAAAVRGATATSSPAPAGSATHGDDAPVQALHGMLGLFADKEINRYGWQAFVIAMDDGVSHVTVFAKDNLTTPQWQKLNKAAKHDNKLTLASLPQPELLAFDQFHVTVGGDKHHFYKDTGVIDHYPTRGVNEPLGTDSWLTANQMAVQFLAQLGVQVTLFSLDSDARVAQKRAAGRPDELETLKFWGIK